jgi:hypothetical protein
MNVDEIMMILRSRNKGVQCCFFLTVTIRLIFLVYRKGEIEQGSFVRPLFINPNQPTFVAT